MVVLSEGGRGVSRGWEARGVGGSEERFSRCLLDRGIVEVGWLALAPSMERLPRERGFLERAASSRGRTTISQLSIFSVGLPMFLYLVFCLLLILT